MKFFEILLLIIFLQIVIYPQNLTDNWLTHFEKSNYLETSSYDETIDFFKKLDNESPYAELISFGYTPQGRSLYALIVSKDQKFDEASLKKSRLPLLFILNGIHSGEIEGKDASMILLREILITREKISLIDECNLIVIPVFNVDGHEFKSPFNRINQNGPKEMGKRTTAQNLNLNRDWMKADTPEMKAMLTLIQKYQPDFFIDNHTTNGADYQYVVTYGIEKADNIDRGLGNFVNHKFLPYLNSKVEEAGFPIAPYIVFKGEGPESGIVDYAAPPRFSTGYFALQNRIALLVETHMLKPYKERVFATLAVIETVIKFLNENKDLILQLNQNADELSNKYSIEKGRYFPISFNTSEQSIPFLFRGVKQNKEMSEISGREKIIYTDIPFQFEIPFYNDIKVVDSVKLSSAYLIPNEWKEIIEIMKLHGIKIDTIKKDTTLKVKRYKFNEPKFRNSPYEGRQTVSAVYIEYLEDVTVPKGMFIVFTNQKALRVIVNLLEPKGSDSFLQWGFFNSIFERKEYFEFYVMEKIAEEMLANDDKLKIEFNKKLSDDENFRNDPYQRLNFFYERSPYFDKQFRLYPVLILE